MSEAYSTFHLLSFNGIHPQIAKDVYVAGGVQIQGDVQIAAGASIWFNSVLRGDVEPIRIGAASNIQDLSMLHTSRGRSPCIVGQGVTVGHKACLHSAIVGDTCLIGMGALVLDDVELGEECLVAAGSLLPPGKKYPPRSFILGSPGRVLRSLEIAEIKKLHDSAKRYQETAAKYRSAAETPTR